ncbi:MAG: HupE/UreJ family protein, partial [Gammaproteobacteria bacterium]
MTPRPAFKPVVLAGLLVPLTAMAHEGSSLPYGSFLAGLAHPVLGIDHFLAMISVGILSAQIGGRAIWTVPCT